MAAHRAVMKTVPKRESKIERNENTRRGYGFHERLPNKAARKRQSDRMKGVVPPLEYVTLDQACKALE